MSTLRGRTSSTFSLNKIFDKQKNKLYAVLTPQCTTHICFLRTWKISLCKANAEERRKKEPLRRGGYFLNDGKNPKRKRPNSLNNYGAINCFAYVSSCGWHTPEIDLIRRHTKRDQLGRTGDGGDGDPLLSQVTILLHPDSHCLAN